MHVISARSFLQCVSLLIFMQHSAAVHQEHLEKARLRHKHAMARVKMEKVLDISYCCNVVQQDSVNGKGVGNQDRLNFLVPSIHLTTFSDPGQS